MSDLTAVAEGQHGVVTSKQAIAAGLGRQSLQRRKQRRNLMQVTTGVLRFPGAPRSWEQQLVTLVLAAGPGAAASHRAAAAMLGIPGFPRNCAPEVTTPRSRRHRGRLGQVHQSRVLPPAHLTAIEGIATTNLARTIVDLSGVVHPGRVERALDNCLAARRVSIPEIADVMAVLARRGRAGIALMRTLLDDRAGTYMAPESELEARFLALVADHRLPVPERQYNVGDSSRWIGRVDFAYPGLGLLVELDGRAYHTAKLDWESDRRRDNDLVAAGWRVIRITWDQIVRHPDQTASLLRRSGVTSSRPAVTR